MEEDEIDNIPLSQRPAVLAIQPRTPSGVSNPTMNARLQTGALPFESNIENYLANNQSRWELVGKAGLGIATEVVAGTIEGASYLLDFKQMVDKLQGSEEEYTNWLADSMKEAKAKVSEGVGKVYQTTEAQEGFAPGDATWWAKNTPQTIGTALSLMIPAGAVAGVAGKFAKLANASAKGINLAEGLSATVASRYAESTMEANQVYEQAYTQLKGTRPDLSEDEIRTRAGKAASKTWITNWAFALQDFMQYNTMLKGFNAMSKGKIGKSILEVGKQTLSEAAEEAGQYITSEEALRTALNDNVDYFGEGFGDRLSKYVKDPEFKASTLLGAVGGAVFSGAGALGNLAKRGGENTTDYLNKVFKDNYEKQIQKEVANYTGNTAKSAVLDNLAFREQLNRHRQAGTLEMLKNNYQQLEKTPDIDPEARTFFKNATEDVEFVQKEQGQLKDSSIPSELHDFVIDAKIEQKMLARLSDQLTNESKKIEQEVLKEKELHPSLVQLKKLQIELEANKIAAKHNTALLPKVEALEAQLKTELANPITELAFSALTTSQDEQWVKKEAQLISINEKMDRVKKDLTATTTQEGRDALKKNLADQKVNEESTKVLNNAEATKEEVLQAASNTTDENLKTALAQKHQQLIEEQQHNNQEETVDTINKALSSPQEMSSEDLANLDPYQGEVNYEPDQENTDPYNFDPSSTILTEDFGGGMTYNEIERSFGKAKADEYLNLREFLSRVDAEQAPVQTKQEPVRTQQDEEAIQKLKELKTVPAWSKIYKTEKVNGKHVPVLLNGVPVLETYWDNSTDTEVISTDVWETDNYSNDITSTPLFKEGDPVLAKLVDNGSDLKWKYTLQQGYRPNPGEQHKWTINLYRVDDKGNQLSDKPFGQLPDGDNDYSKSPELTALRGRVLNSPTQSLITNVTSKNVGDHRKTDKPNTLEVLEFDYYQNKKGEWVYGKTPYRPTFVQADYNGNIIGQKTNAGTDTMEGVSENPELQRRIANVVHKVIEKKGETSQKPKGNVKGGLFTLRTNPDGNLSMVMVYPDNLNTDEIQWVRNNLTQKLQDRDVEELSQVYFIPESFAGQAYTSEKTGSITKADRRRFHVVKFSEDNTEFLIPVIGLKGEQLWVRIKASGENSQLGNFMNKQRFLFSYVNEKGQKGDKLWDSSTATPEQLSLIYKAFETILNHKQTSKRNIKNRFLNSENEFKDIVTGTPYPTYYDFLKTKVTTDLPGTKTPGAGETSSYSFANSRVRLNPDPTPTKFIVDEVEKTIVKGIETPEPTIKPVKEGTTTLPTQEEIKKMLEKRNAPKNRVVEGGYIFGTITPREINWFKQIFGEEFLNVAKNVDHVISTGGVHAFGLYHDALVTLAQLAETGTLYHEAFHFVFDPQLGLVTYEQREKVLNEAAKVYGINRSYDKNKPSKDKLRPVDYALKSAIILESPRADEIFRKGDKNNWNLDKILQELQVPKEQQELIKSFNTRNREEILTSLLANYSYTIEVNTAQAKGLGINEENIDPEDLEYYNNLDKDKPKISSPSQFYSNLTVPGGTNYIENEIATPAITPSIKGHAQFSTENGIGWFRSDVQLEKANTPSDKLSPYSNDLRPSKTRRILEVQSDLFQKGRESSYLINHPVDLGRDNEESFYFKGNLYEHDGKGNYFRNAEIITKKEIEAAYKAVKTETKTNKENQFLQLLNKDNNWVTFFIKSIIQDSAKKGYEKVLFPTGNTASKVEGHSTLEEFKKQKEDRIKELNKQQNKLDSNLDQGVYGMDTSDYDIRSNKINSEIDQLEQELERVEKEGFAALKPIYKFYEETVGNILKKNYKVKEVKDEYGNTWLELNLDKEAEAKIKLRTNQKEAYEELTGDEQLEEKLAEDFRAYMLSGGKVLPKVKEARGFFQKLWNAIKKLIGLKSPIEKLFSDIATKSLTQEQRQTAWAVQANSKNRLDSEKYRLLPGFEGYNYKTQQEAAQATAYKVINMAKDHADSQRVELLDVLKQKGNLDKYLDAVYEDMQKDAVSMEKGLAGREEDWEKYATYKSMGVAINNSFPGPQGMWEDKETETKDLQIERGFKDLVLKEFKKFGFTLKGKDITDYEGDSKQEINDEFTQEEKDFIQEEDSKERLFNQNHTSSSPNDTLGLRLKLFLSTIEEPNSNKTILGTPKYIDFPRAMSMLKARLADSFVPLTKLEELSHLDPISKVVFEALAKEQQKGNSKLVDQFNTYMNLSLHNFKTVILEYDPVTKSVIPKFIDADRSSANKAIKNDWQAEFVRKKFMDADGTNINQSKISKLLKEVQTFSTEYYTAQAKKNPIPFETVKTKFDGVLKEIGISVPPQVYSELEQDKFKVSTLERWFFGKKESSITQFLTNAQNEINPFSGTSIVDVLADKSKNFIESEKGDVFLDEFKNQVNPINLPSYVTEIQKKLRDKEEGTKLKKFLQQDPFFKGNRFVQLFGTGQAETMTLDFLSAFKVNEDKTKDFEARTAGDSLITRITTFYNNRQDSVMGSIFLGTPSDKAKQLMESLPKQEQAEEFVTGVFKQTMLNEIYRIQTIRKFKDVMELSYINPNSEKFLYLDELNNIPNLTANVSTGEVSQAEADAAIKKANEVIKDYVNTQYQYFKNYLVNKGVIELEEGAYSRGKLPAALFQGKTLDSVLKSFFFNDLGWRIEMSKVFNGDIAQYKSIDDYYKRGYQSVTPGTVPFSNSNETYTRGIYPKQMIKSKFFGDVNKTDAQSYITTELRRKWGMLLNDWSSEMEDLYQFAWKDGKTVNQAIRDSGVNREQGDYYRKALRKANTQVLKPFQFNDRELTLPDGSKLVIKEQFKDSMMWLNPELANRHTELNKLHEFMRREGFDVMSAEDTVKVGSYGIIKDFEQYNKKTDSWKKRTCNFSDIRFPQLPSSKHKEDVSGSQFWKLLTGNLNPKDPRIASLNKLWEEKLEGEATKLMNELGLDSSWTLSQDFETRKVQMYKLKTLLENELGSRNVNDSYTDAIEIVLNEFNKPDFAVNLGFPVYDRKFISILTNLFKKRILQAKSTGTAMVNFADFGVQDSAKSSNLTLVENKDGSIEAEIGMPISFFREIGLNFKDYVDSNNKIKWEEISEEQRKALQFILYRIPTSNKSSMIPVRVVMIVPESSGNVVMLPGELTKQQGLDFDYDKSQLIRRVITDRKIDKTHVDTKLFEEAWSILTDKESIKELLTPLDFDTIEKDIYKEYVKEGIIQPEFKSHFLSIQVDTEMEIRNKHGQAMIGIDSRANTAHAVIQTIPDYVVVAPNAGFNLRLAPKGSGMTQRDLEKAYIEGFNKLGQKFDSEGTLISKNYGELQQSSLDNAKSPIKALLNIFPVLDPVALYLTGLGVPLRTTFKFLNQPILREWMRHYDLEGTADKATKSLLSDKPDIDAEYKRIAQTLLSDQMLDKGLKDPNDIQSQAMILKEFTKLMRVSQTMTKINNVLSVDTFGDMTGLESIEAFLNQKDEVTDPEGFIYIDPVVFDIKKAPANARRLAAYYEHALNNSVKLTKQFVPYLSQVYQLSKDTFANFQGLKKVTNKKTLRNLNTFLNYHVMESSGKINSVLDKISPNYRTRWSFLADAKGRNIGNYIDSVVNSNPHIKNNYLIQNIVNYPSKKNGVFMIGVNNTNSLVGKSEMTKGWYDLLHDSNESVRTMATDLVRYALSTSGLSYNTRSFIDLVPTDFWVTSNLVKEHKVLVEGLNTGITVIDAEGAIRSFVRHNFQVLDEIPEAYYTLTKKGAKTTLTDVVANEGHVKSFKVNQNDPLANSARRQNIPTFVKIWDETNNRYRLYEGSPLDQYQFKEVQPLGEPKNYWEVTNNPDGRKTSVHPINQESGSSAPWDKFKTDSKVYPLFTNSKPGQNKYIDKYIPTGIASASEVIDILLANEVNKDNLKTLKVLKRNVGKITTRIESEVLPAGITGQFKVQKTQAGIFDNFIQINSFENHSEQNLRDTLIHELIHAYSAGILENPTTEEEKSFVRNIKRLLEEAKTRLPKNLYALKNEHEFLAELASKKQVRDLLRKESDLWTRLKRLIRKLLGFKDEYDQVLEQFYQVLDSGEDLQSLPESVFNEEAQQKEKVKGKRKIDELQQMLSNVKSRHDRLKRQGDRIGASKVKNNLELLTKLVATNRSQAVVRYMLDTQEEMNSLNQAYYRMGKDPANINSDALQSMLEQLVSYQLLDSFSTMIRRNPLDFAPDEESAENLTKNIDQMRADVRILEEKLKDLRLKRYAYVVYNTSSDPNKNLEKIIEELEVASNDITWFKHWEGIGTDSRDIIVSTNHQKLSQAHSEAYRSTQTDLYKKDKEAVDVHFEYLVPNSTDTNMHYQKWNGKYNKTGIYKALDEYEAWLKKNGQPSSTMREKFSPILDSESFTTTSDGIKFISPASTEGRKILGRPEGDPLRQFYETTVLGYLQAQEKLPRFLRPGLRVPSIQRSLLEGVLDEKGINKLKAISEAAISSVRRRYDESDRKSVDEAGNPIKGLPVRFISKQDGVDGRLKMSEVSLDIATTVGLFMNESHLRDELSPILSDLELGKGIAGDRKVVKATKRLHLPGFGGWLTSEREAATLSSGQLEPIKGENSEAYKKVVQDLEIYAYGEGKKDEGDIKIGKTKLDIGKITDTFLKLTGFNLLFGRIAIPLTNLLVGKLTQMKEAIGGNFITVKDSAAGEKFWATEALKSIADFALREKKTKFGKFFSFLNPFDNQRVVMDLGVSTNYTKTIFEKIVRSGGSSTELYLGSTALGAVLNREEFKATNPEGRKVSLYDAIEFSDTGKPVLIKGFQYKGKSEVTNEQLQELKDYTLRVYQIMNGVYNQVDSGNSQQYALGRALMFMRRWLPEGINTRWRTRYFDQRLNKENEGHYVSALVALNNIFTRDGLLQNTVDAVRVMTWMGTTNDELLLHPTEINLPQDQKDAIISLRKANVRKTLFELYTIAALTLLLAFGWDDEDDDSYVKYMMARVNREMKTFLSPSTAWDVLRSPSAAMSTIQGVFKVVGDTGEAGYSIITGQELPEYKQGDYKGQTKIGADIRKQVGLGWMEQFESLDSKTSLIQRGFR